MRIVRSIWKIINLKTLVVTVLSVGATWFCIRQGIKADFPLTLVGIAFVFPVVFSIDSAYKRRERALMLLADCKAHLYSIYQATGDWIHIDGTKDFQQEVKQKVIDIYRQTKELFTSAPENAMEHEKGIFDKISDLSKILQKYRALGLEPGEMSRINQYTSKVAVAIENLKGIYHYRTPITLRAYSKVFIYTFPILYAPYFVFQSEHYTHGLEFMMPVVFSFILVSLDNIQDHLEHPFDQVGEDDIKFDVKEFEEMMH